MTVKVLFVCLGNICRSPTAHGVFIRQVFDAGLFGVITVDSAGTSGWHEGNPPDSRSAQEARTKGYDLSFIRSRQVQPEDFVEQHLILAMDEDNLSALKSQCPAEHQEKLHLFLDLANDITTREVPDPYYGGNEGFSRVLMLIEHGGQALLDYIQKTYLSR
ncbi:low molecular weight phosphotyrosine protein phosphatase [Endozoicomonas sp.]|nr:low molecular weight phosphotyrosine protein phosphatase [Endozoicomonas sp.]